MSIARPMLAEKASDEQVAKMIATKGPLWAFPKIDGVRCLNTGLMNEREGKIEGRLLSRSMKRFPNEEIHAIFDIPELRGHDGELTVTEPNDPRACRAASAAVATIKGSADWRWWVFDNFRNPDLPFHERYARIASDFGLLLPVYRLPFQLITSMKEFHEYEREIVERQGYEGLILRDPNARYKQGRATVNEGSMVKVKRFVDDEAEIVSFVEEVENTNEATLDERGYTKRSGAKSGLLGKGTLGAFICRDPKSGVEFRVGGGMSAEERTKFWLIRDTLVGKTITYKHLPTGAKDKPRHTGFVAFREKFDMDTVNHGLSKDAADLI